MPTRKARAERYREQTADMLKFASRTRSPLVKAEYERLAAEYENLASEMDKDARRERR